MAVQADRRKWRRFPRSEELFYLLGDERIGATIKDISLGGAYLCSERLPDVGESIEFALRGKQRGMPLVMATGEVVRKFTDENEATDQWGFGLQWTSLKSPGGPVAVKGLFDEISGEFPAVKWVAGRNAGEKVNMNPDSSDGSVSLWIRTGVTSQGKRFSAIVTKLGSRKIELLTSSEQLTIDSTVEMIIDGDHGRKVLITGSVVDTYRCDDGNRSEIRIVDRQDN